MRSISASSAGRSLQSPAPRRSTPPGRRSLLKWALGAVVVETELHRTYLGAFGIDATAAANAEPTPDCLAYTSYLLATAYHEPWEVTVAALLPCFWIYWDVGKMISRRNVPGNAYQAWIDTYSGDEFGEAVQSMIATTDAAAKATTPALRARMHSAFTRACQYEYLFWDGAYQQRGWPG